MTSDDPSQSHPPDQTTTDPQSDPNLPPGTPALPRDPKQPIHKKPRVFIHRPGEDPNEETSAYRNTSYLQAMRTIELSDFTRVHQAPCVRDAFLPGISGGLGVGALRFITGANVMKSCNWASATFVTLSLGMYQYCQRQRRKEKDGIRQAVSVLDKKQKEKEVAETARKESEAVKSQENQQQSKSMWSTFKFW